MLKIIQFPFYLLKIPAYAFLILFNIIFRLSKLIIHSTVIFMAIFLFYIFCKEFINISNDNVTYSLVGFFSILIFIGAWYAYKDDITDELALLSSQCGNDITEIKTNFTLAYSTFLPFSFLCGLGFGIIYLVQNTTSSSNNSSNSNTYYSNYENSDENSDEDDETADIADMSCTEILETVVDDGDLISDLDDSDMNSSALDYIALYEYEGLYYLVVEFTSSSKKYVYCDINYGDWNEFVDNAGDSYGESFNEYLTNSNCNCN